MPNKSLEIMKREVYNLNTDHGWYDDERSMGDDIALLHSEVSEILENYREVGTQYRTREVVHLKDCPNTDYLVTADCFCLGKPDDVAAEAADVFIRLLDFAKRYDIDLEHEYERKMAYNRTRPYKHGGKAL